MTREQLEKGKEVMNDIWELERLIKSYDRQVETHGQPPRDAYSCCGSSPMVISEELKTAVSGIELSSKTTARKKLKDILSKYEKNFAKI